MAIVTISRELAALGDETARELAKKLGYRFVDKYALEERIKAYGFAGSKLQKYDEKKPSLWASLSGDRDDYLHFLKSAIFAEACQGNAVFIGRGAATILKSVPGRFSVFLAAHPEARLERVKSYFRCDEKRAQHIIEQSDRDREGFHRYFFNVKWKDAGNYHLALNTGHLQPDLCAETIKYIRDRFVTESMEAESVLRIEELTLAENIKRRIFYEKEVLAYHLEVSVSGSQIMLHGTVNAHSSIDLAVSCARELAPEHDIQSEIQVIQEYSFIP